MASISSFSGIASGIQWADLIDQMMNLESARKLTPLKTQVGDQQGRRIAWTTYESLLNKLKSAATPMRDRSAFSVLQTSVGTSATGKALLTASASPSATPGSYSVEVISMAKADKVSGGPVAGTSTPLAIAGEFFINGHRVDVAATDSLAAIRDKINSVNTGTNASGVSATILSTSSTESRLILTSEHTGTRGLELVDGGSGVLTALGVTSGATAANTNPQTGMAESQRFSSTTTPIASMLGVTAPPAVTTVVINGQKIEVDLVNDTFLSLMAKVQTTGGQMTSVEEGVGGRTFHRLSVDGAVTADATATDPAASQRIVELLGFAKSQHASTIAVGKDSLFRIDGFTMSRRTNTVSDAIPGVSLNLLAANGGDRTSSVTGSGLTLGTDPKTVGAGNYPIEFTTTTDPVLGTHITGVTIGGQAAEWDAEAGRIMGAAGSAFEGVEIFYSGAPAAGLAGSYQVAGDIAVQVDVTRNLDATVQQIEAFAAAYNELAAFADKQREPGASLYANGALRSMQRSITTTLLAGVAGLSPTNPYSRASVTGVALSDEGKLIVDAGKLKSALTTNLIDVQALFATSGTATDGQVSFIGNTSATKPGTFAIDISIAASRASHSGSPVPGGFYAATDGISDLLSISDSGSGKTVDFTVTHGMSLNEIAAGLSALFANEKMGLTVEASGGTLHFESTDYGSNTTFGLEGAALANLGLTAGTYAGTDVAGTIGGLAATGSGRILTGVPGGETEGLAIRYTGTGTGPAGELNYVLGVTGMIDRVLDQMTRAGDGVIAGQVTSIDASIAALNRRAQDVESRLELRREALTQQFIRMEQAMSLMNSQSSWLSGQINAMTASNSK